MLSRSSKLFNGTVYESIGLLRFVPGILVEILCGQSWVFFFSFFFFFFSGFFLFLLPGINLVFVDSGF